jgi:hypothetical protein
MRAGSGTITAVTLSVTAETHADNTVSHQYVTVLESRGATQGSTGIQQSPQARAIAGFFMSIASKTVPEATEVGER